jgi:hypothetical protein
MDEKRLAKLLKVLHDRLFAFSGDYDVRKANDVCYYLDSFPEDYQEGRHSVDELVEQLQKLKYGFETLAEAILEMNNEAN